MLKRLTISNYALIDVLDIEIPEHLVIITGDSGAGKSILLGALSLLLGGKCDASVLKDPSRNCVVEAEFSDAVIRRVVSAGGRSRVFINDEPANLEQVRELAAAKIDIHSQNSQLLLGSADFALSVVDSYAGNAELLENYRKAYNSHLELSSKLEKVKQQRQQRERERDYLQFRYDQLAAAKLQEGEMAQLEEQQKTLANAEQIKETLLAAAGAIYSGDDTVDERLKAVVRSLEKISGVYPGAEEFKKRVESCRVELKDVAVSLDGDQEKIDASAQTLQQVEERLALLFDLMHRNDAANEAELIAARDSYAAQLEDVDTLAREQAELETQVKKADSVCEQLCKRLTAARTKVLEPLSELLEQSIRELDMPQAQFRVECVPASQRGRNGAEGVRFMFSPADGRFFEAAKAASGGEMSRIMLCIKAVLARNSALPTVIFDEIDTGMSGSLADKVGRKIVEIGKSIQVIAITHLPQVAAKGNAHFLVYKDYLPQGAVSHIRRIEGSERLEEIARMISGSTISTEAVAAAAVLLKEAN
ncbi:MAG: AAA family ATPase [Bacteroidales bacterium]|nr:AAA family ATPase [Bacteroidales bacterium]